MWYKNTPGPDKTYEEALTKVTPTKVMVTYVYAYVKSTSVAEVVLAEDTRKLCKMWTPPHISLFKDKELKWQDMGRIVQRGKDATDWFATTMNTEISASTGLTRKPLFWTVTVQEGIHLHTKQQ
ncbi:hypothetical protein CHARACLAT_032921 [Characodon lateralis]|uniref:Uncharacterized protein n=1 Tax=Characodon lateralis TaxID=208331 RepID=A0ABU7CTY2_9TELE|nr:hypothetical protein [Characodon lateralis]